MKILGAAEGVQPCFEPDRLDEWGIGESGMHPFIETSSGAGEYRRMYQKVFQGYARLPVSATKRYARHILRQCKAAVRQYNRNNVVLVKSVFSLPNTRWIYQNFRPRVVVLLRNPYSIAHSIHRRWPNARLKAENFDDGIASQIEEYRSLCAGASTAYEQLAVRIGAYYKLVMEAAQENADWSIVTHESLCENPVEEYRRLYDKLGLGWTSEIEHYVAATNKPKLDDAVQHVQRMSSEEVDKWKALLSVEEASQIKRYYEAVGPDVYKGMI